MEKQTMGKFIAALRRANGMTQADLAERLGVTNKSVSKWECDEGYPDLSLIPVIAEIFNVTSDEILKGCRIIAVDGNTATEQPKIEKQVNRLIQKTLINFKHLSIIPIFLTVIGLVFLILPPVLHSGGTFAVICIVLFLLLILSSIVLELVFANTARSALFNCSEAENADLRLLAATRTIENITFNIITSDIIFVVGIPFLYLVGLPAYAFPFIAPILYIYAYIVKMNSADKKYYDISEQPQAQKSLKKLNILCAVSSAVVFIVPLVLYIVFGYMSTGLSTHTKDPVIQEKILQTVLNAGEKLGESAADVGGDWSNNQYWRYNHYLLILSAVLLTAIGLFYIFKRRKLVKEFCKLK